VEFKRQQKTRRGERACKASVQRRNPEENKGDPEKENEAGNPIKAKKPRGKFLPGQPQEHEACGGGIEVRKGKGSRGALL